MESLILQLAVSATVAGLLTYCDLDAVFAAPPSSLKWGAWFHLQAWWWGFILANGALAALLCFALHDKDYFKDLNPWFGAFLAGASYTAMIRLKFTTLPNNTPVGIDTFYEALKGVVHRRINRIIIVWRSEESRKLAKENLAELREQALIMVGTDALMSDEAKNAAKVWINQTAADVQTPEGDRRLSIAIYIITGQKAFSNRG